MKKYIYILLAMFIILDSFQIVFYESDLKVDIYLLKDHSRYLCNIMYDLSHFFGFAALFYILWREVSNLFLPFFIWWILNIIGYFLVYAQMINLVNIPILLILILWIEKRK